jgi:hypothetical protein
VRYAGFGFTKGKFREFFNEPICRSAHSREARHRIDLSRKQSDLRNLLVELFLQSGVFSVRCGRLPSQTGSQKKPATSATATRRA